MPQVVGPKKIGAPSKSKDFCFNFVPFSEDIACLHSNRHLAVKTAGFSTS